MGNIVNNILRKEEIKQTTNLNNNLILIDKDKNSIIYHVVHGGGLRINGKYVNTEEEIYRNDGILIKNDLINNTQEITKMTNEQQEFAKNEYIKLKHNSEVCRLLREQEIKRFN